MVAMVALEGYNKMGGSSLVGSLVLFCLGCSSRPSRKHFVLHSSFVPIAPQAAQASVLGRLSLSMSLLATVSGCLYNIFSSS
jgi:hypothetical protein